MDYHTHAPHFLMQSENSKAHGAFVDASPYTFLEKIVLSLFSSVALIIYASNKSNDKSTS